MSFPLSNITLSIMWMWIVHHTVFSVVLPLTFKQMNQKKFLHKLRMHLKAETYPQTQRLLRELLTNGYNQRSNWSRRYQKNPENSDFQRNLEQILQLQRCISIILNADCSHLFVIQQRILDMIGSIPHSNASAAYVKIYRDFGKMQSVFGTKLNQHCVIESNRYYRKENVLTW